MSEQAEKTDDQKKRKRSAAVSTVGASQSLSRVGIIALLGFAVGVAWPRLAGISLVPEAPVEEPKVDTTTAEPAPTAPVEEAETRQLTSAERLAIGEPKITSCRTSEKKKATSCGDLDTDALVHSVLASLGECPAAGGVFGKLSLGFDLDFDKGKVAKIRSGRSTDLPDSVRDEILRCAEDGFASVQLAGVNAEHSSYTVFYILDFKTPESVVEEENAVSPASGRATVRWKSALIRQEAERDSKVRARLLAGARVVVTGRQGEWYRVKYDAKGREGWVHGAALGL